MTPNETRLLEFVTARLDSLLRRPSAWGSNPSIEDQVLQLLELRRFVLDPSTGVNDTQKLMRAYTRFISRTLDNATAEPLAAQLERRGRPGELTTLLRMFVEQELAELVAEESVDITVIVRPRDVEAAHRIIEQLRIESELHLRHRPQVYEAIEFPDVKAR